MHPSTSVAHIPALGEGHQRGRGPTPTARQAWSKRRPMPQAVSTASTLLAMFTPKRAYARLKVTLKQSAAFGIHRRMVLVPLPVEAAGPGHLLGQKPRPGGSWRGEGRGRTPWCRGGWWLLAQMLLEWMSWAGVGAYAYWDCINL